MIAETVAVDEAAIEAEINEKTDLAKGDVQREFDGIAKYADDLKAAVRIKNQYLAANTGDLMSVHYGMLYDRVTVVAYLQDFAVLPALLHLFARAGYKRANGYEEPQQTKFGELEVRYNIEDRNGAIDLTMSPRAVDGAVCNRVKTGEIVHSTYAIQCHGKPVVDESEPEPATD
jgi:hypothetical protein